MKKIILILLSIATIFSMTSCMRGNTSMQEQIMNEYVLKYCGAYEIVDKTPGALDMTMSYTLKDTTDGFEYMCMTHEVPWSDIGFGDSDEEHTVLINTTFADAYLGYLLNTKIDKAALQAILDANSDINLKVEYTEKYVLQPSGDYPSIAIVCDTPREQPIAEIAQLFLNADSRNYLKHTSLCQYTVTNGVLSAQPAFRYDFFSHYACNQDEWVGVEIFSEYMVAKDKNAHVTIDSITTECPKSNIKLKDGWAWADTTTSTGTRIVFTMNDVKYEFFTEPCIQPIEGDSDTYGIVEGSYLDVIANEQSGNRPLIISIYISKFPHSYISLGIHCEKLEQGEEAK